MAPNRIEPSRTAGFAIGLLVASLGAFNSAAASSDRHVPVKAHKAPRARYQHLVRSGVVTPHAHTAYGQYVPGRGDILIYGPGYVFVPGHGILGEACDLPTSTCTNEYRDVQ